MTFVRPSALALALSLLALPVSMGACTASADDDDTAVGDDDFTEGSAEARAILALVNDTRVGAGELIDHNVPSRGAKALVAHRDGPDATPATADDDPFDTIRELKGVSGVGRVTLDRLLAYAKEKGLMGGGVKVVFSPQPAWEQSHLAQIVALIDGAQESLDVAMYSYSDAKIGHALERAAARGVNVRFVFETAGEDKSLDGAALAASKSGRLEAAGVDVRYVNKIMHHKFVLVDGPRHSADKASTARLASGSANWSSSAALKFDENTIVVEGGQPNLVLKFQREFDHMWSHSRDLVSKPFEQTMSTLEITDALVGAPSDVDALFTSANFSVRDTTFSSTGANTVADALVAAIAGAQRSIHIASGHLRSRPVAEALLAKRAAAPALDIRVYLDGQEYIAAGTHRIQEQKRQDCIERAFPSESKIRLCNDKGFLFGYQIGEAGISVKYKYYAYRWDHSYAPQMHHKYMVIDGATLYSGSYNLSDNAEHATFENMTVWRGPANAAIVKSFEDNFESIWQTGQGKLAELDGQIEQDPRFPIVFEPMALSWSEVTALKQKIRAKCPAVDSAAFRSNAAAHRFCE